MDTLARRTDTDDPYSVRSHTLAHLMVIRRGLAANIALTDDDSPARVPIAAHLLAVDTEIDRRSAPPQHPVSQLTDGELKSYREWLEYTLETDRPDADILRRKLSAVIAEQKIHAAAQRSGSSDKAVRS